MDPMTLLRIMIYTANTQRNKHPAPPPASYCGGWWHSLVTTWYIIPTIRVSIRVSAVMWSIDIQYSQRSVHVVILCYGLHGPILYDFLNVCEVNLMNIRELIVWITGADLKESLLRLQKGWLQRYWWHKHTKTKHNTIALYAYGVALDP